MIGSSRAKELSAFPPFVRREVPWQRRVVETSHGEISAIVHGAGERDVVLFHGNPTWSYLWRKVIRALDGRGLRIIAPDLLGFGASAKPRRPADHQLDMHIAALVEVMGALGAERPILVGQDWGGPIAAGVGMRLAASGAPPGGFVLANTAVLEPARPFRSKAFHRFSHLPILSDVAFRGLLFPIPTLGLVQGDRLTMGPTELAAYAWPLLSLVDRAGPLGLARMVPDSEAHPSTAVMDDIGAYMRRAAESAPIALVWGNRDPILGRALERHRRAFARATVRETEAGHFLQEEVPFALADAIVEVAGKVSG